WAAPADADHPYGHGRIETMVTVFIGAALALVGLGLAYNALATLAAEDKSTPGWLAFVVACVSIVLKEGLYRWTARVGRRLRSSALAANAWHHRSDAFSSVPVAVAVLGSHVQPAWTFLDHVAALLVAVMILQAAWRIVAPAMQQLSDAGVTEAERTALDVLVRETRGVRSAHGLRTRRLGPDLYVDLHVLVDPSLTVHEGHEIARAVKRRLLREGEDVVDVLVHIEPFEE
ncbi:MAG TPA: cation diffusion facilitator family transporter, partial [Candidatus Hydrogenedentes bacterium]|nr:cation diffusion facilitator family transporter [Candidatus Hydrogenedentota bacterium]